MRRIIFLWFIIAVSAFAAETGRILGKVIDNSTKEPLVGVNIVVEGTELGAATDEYGKYLVPFVPAGTYMVVASYIGYNTVTQKDVLVISNQTTNLDFQITQSIIAYEPIVITAERAMVIKTQTQTTRTTTAKEISKLPITEINQIITLQAGVSTSELGTHIRGGRANEIAYFVDGILTRAPHYGEQSVRLSKESVEEVNVYTGGFDAEYGEALSGVVTFQTKEGSEKLGGLFRYTTDEIFNSENLNYGYNLYEFNFGGGLLTKARARYFMSAEAHLTDAFQEGKWKGSSPRFDYKVQGKLSYSLPNAKGKAILSGFYSREMYRTFGDMWGEMSMIYHLDHRAADMRKNYLATLTFNYMPRKSEIIETKFGYTRWTRFYAVRDLAREDSLERKWYEDYMFKADHFPKILSADLPDTVKKKYLVDSLCNHNMPYHYDELERHSAQSLRRNPYGATGWFYTVGDERMWRFLFSRDYQGNISITNAFGKVHEFKSGVNLVLQNVGWFDNNLPWTLIPFWDIYEKNPIKVAFYVQDRMDFEGIIARVGMRFDYFDSKASGLKNPTNIADTTMIVSTPKWRISPRLGFSLPITERSKFRFNYGHFYQTPTAHDLYRSTTPEVVWLLLRRYNSIIGNPNLTVEKTVAYEIGYENQLSDIFAFGLLAYYKDVHDLIQTRQFYSLPYPYYQVTNVDYGNVKGIELTLKKKLADYWFFDLSYTIQFARGTASYAWQHYYDIYNQGVDPITGEYRLPQVDFWLDFDERHIINSSIGFDFDKNFFLLPLRNFYSDFIFSYHSGFPYTPTDLKGNPLGDQNSARMPGSINVDANITKDLSFYGLNFSLFTNIYNLLNAEQITYVFSATGKPDDDGAEGTILVTDFLPISRLSSYYTPQADYNHDGLNSPVELHSEYIKARRLYMYNNPFHWRPGFRMRIGMVLRF